MSELPEFTAVCIAGMHRSGTSLVARLLQKIGLYLGPDEQLAEGAADNLDGYWENIRFVTVNDGVLSAHGGAWDLPPDFPAGWVEAEITRPYRERAAILLRQLGAAPVFGWKDPRNSLTFPLWRSVAPRLKAVICVRHPLEVALSLRERNLRTPTAALHLWLQYNRAVFAATNPDDRVLVEFGTLLANPAAELRRVAEAIGLSPSDAEIASATGEVNRRHRHHSMTWQDLLDLEVDAEVLRCYRDLASEAGVSDSLQWQIPERREVAALIPYESVEALLASMRVKSRPPAQPHSTLPASDSQHQRRLRMENDQLTNALRYYEGRIEELRASLAHMQAQRDWQAQDRDHVASLLSAAGGRIAELDETLDDARDEISSLERQIEDMKRQRQELEKTRAVRLQRRYWSALEKIRGGGR